MDKWENIISSRKNKSVFSSISDERGEELKYNNIPISNVIPSIGNVIGLLWFKKDFSSIFTKYIDLVLTVTADHGPCVSGAHNTIVSTRAGKDIVSSLCSGLLTIGPRFGRDINEAGYNFYYSYKNKISPNEFVNNMKKEGKLIQGIGHKIKTKDNPDMRIVALEKYVHENFKDTPIISYARQVEEITLKKRSNLILNVDGYIAASIIDGFMMENMTEFEIEEIINNDILNGFFVLARTIGFIGHHIDQKRLKQGLYRQSDQDVEYIL